MNIKISKTIEDVNEDTEEVSTRTFFKYFNSKYVLNCNVDCLDEVEDFDLIKKDDKLDFVLNKNDKALRIFDFDKSKKKEMIYVLRERKENIHLEIIDKKKNTRIYCLCKDGSVLYTTNNSDKYVELNEEQIALHSIMFDEKVDQEFLLNQVRPFLKNIDSNKYKEMFKITEDLDPYNVVEKEVAIKLVEDRIENFKELLVSKTIKIESSLKND